MTAHDRGTLGYRLSEHELAVLGDEQAEEPADEPAAEPADEPADEVAAPDDPPPDAPAAHPLAVPSPRDLAYAVRLIDAALLVIDAGEIAGDKLSLRDLLATRDLALRR
jgi:pyruvate/2-oxoglutarate dehydrogenase complex dihydrolipoamide acyltransferase (E2) component